jgi:hypothetical protein
MNSSIAALFCTKDVAAVSNFFIDSGIDSEIRHGAATAEDRKDLAGSRDSGAAGRD